MSKAHGWQKSFDRDGDGRLSLSEWNNWYYAAVGEDEEQRRRRARRRGIEEARLRAIIPLEQGAYEILSGLEAHLSEPQIGETVWELVLYCFSWAFCGRENRTEEKTKMLATFCKAYLPGYDELVLKAGEAGNRMNEKRYRLDETCVGSFWKEAIDALPPYDPCASYPEWLKQVLFGMCRLMETLTGEDPFQQMAAAVDRRWEYVTVMTPDPAVAEDAVRRWDFSVHEWALRDLLVSHYPQLAQRWKQEELGKMDEYDILKETYQEDPNLAIQMWKLLLDMAQEHLGDPKPVEDDEKSLGLWPADTLIQESMEFLWGRRGCLKPLLDVLNEDERLARQLFQSACVGLAQESILEECAWYGERALRERLLKLLRENPCPHEPAEWESAALKEQGQSAEENEGREQDDGTEYSYCEVEVGGISRPLAYMTGGLPLQVGDQVEVPVGRENTPKAGRVVQVRNYTRAEAPWPPERTKTVCKKLP